MQVLLLSRGDAAAKDLLRRVLAARYGFGAPALDSMILSLKGRARIKIARIPTWVSLETCIYFQTPMRARWEYNIRPVGLPITVGVHAYDGARYRKKQGDHVETHHAPPVHEAMRDRVWVSTLMMLSPLVRPEVEIKRDGERILTASRIDTGTCVTMYFNDDYTLEHLEFPTLDIETNETKLYRLRFSHEQMDVGGIILPSVITMLWGEEPRYELSPVSVEINPPIDGEKFQMAE